MTRKLISLVIAVCFALYSHGAYALPQGGTVVDGTATITYAGDDMTVAQTSDRIWADWNSFSIGGAESVIFIQPGASSIALNRVIGGNPSLILGALTANGRVFLINPNGIVFGANAIVDTAGILASTLDIDMSPTDFVNGTGTEFTFTGPGGSVVNYAGVPGSLGEISLNQPGGFVTLLGSSVKNVGLIRANLGRVILAAGEQMTVDLDPAGLISVAVNITQGTDRNDDGEYAAVNNRGEIYADGGQVILSAEILGSVFESAINNDGIIEANSIGGADGHVLLQSDQNIELNGTITASGSINIEAPEITCGNPIEDILLTRFDWEYLREITRDYKFLEFGYYYLVGGELVKVVLSRGTDIGRDGFAPLSGSRIADIPGMPIGHYTIFKEGRKILSWYQDNFLNADGLKQHLKFKNVTELWWEDMWNQGDEDFNDAIIDFVRTPIVIHDECRDDCPPEEELGTYWERMQEFRVYYEILDPSQFLSFEPAQYLGLYAYHPLTPSDFSAFDEIQLDAAAYEFIEDNIKAKKPLAPYFGL